MERSGSRLIPQLVAHIPPLIFFTHTLFFPFSFFLRGENETREAERGGGGTAVVVLCQTRQRPPQPLLCPFPKAPEAEGESDAWNSPKWPFHRRLFCAFFPGRLLTAC